MTQRVRAHMAALALCAALLAGCDRRPGWVPTPRPAPTPAATVPAPLPALPRPDPSPMWETASRIDPRRLGERPDAYRGANVALVGVATGVAAGDGSTRFVLAARSPNLTTWPVGVELPPGVAVVEGGCYTVFGVVAGGGAWPPFVHGYRLHPVPGDGTRECG